MRRFSLFVFLLIASGLTACQDATGVGIGLIGEGSDPSARTVFATALDTTAVPYPTAGFATGTPQQPRVLVGRVADALYGDAVATAYIDALRPATVPTGFDRSAVTSVILELVRDYTYGDTTATLPVEVRLVEGNWSPDGLPADTTLGTSGVIATATIAPQDSVWTLTMPASAFAGRDTVFTSPQFSTLFEGFALSVPETGAPLPGAVVGFHVSNTRSRLRVATATDTVSFALGEVYTHLQQSPPTMAPLGVLPLRAGSPLGALRVSFERDSLGTSTALARAVLSIPLPASVDDGPFRRPRAREVGIYARPEAGGSSFLLVAQRHRAGDLRTGASPPLTQLVQNWLLGRGTLRQELEIRFQTIPISLDVLPVATGPGGGLPRLVLTVVDPT